MKKFSYSKEFNRVSDVVRLGNADDVRISYSVFVGDPNDDADTGTFLGVGFFSADDFTTWSDAAKAKVLVSTVLEHVDDHAQKNSVTQDEQRNMRHEIYQCIEDTVATMLEYRDDEHFGNMLVAELQYNLNNVLAKYLLR